jgi:alanyl-tRNA synthetase
MTTRLYYTDATLLAFTAHVTAREGDRTRIVLDRTAFYPTSGGQPHDLGTLNGVAVLDVIDDDERIVHVVAAPIEGDTVEGLIDAARRRDHMEQHSAQHLLSAIAADRFGWETASVHFGEDHSTIEFAVAQAADADLATLLDAARAAVMAAHPVTISFEEHAAAIAAGLRKPPARSGEIRVVTIAGIDRSACGGTHVATTAEIGAIAFRGVERVRGHVRLSYLAGGRVMRHLAQRDALVAELARALSCAEGELAELMPKRTAELQSARAQVAVLEGELAGHRVRALLTAAPLDAEGVRRVAYQAVDESPTLLRAMAQAVAAETKAVLVITSASSILIGTSTDSGVDAGALLKAALAEQGGKGGGSARLAQGSTADPAALAREIVAR